MKVSGPGFPARIHSESEHASVSARRACCLTEPRGFHLKLGPGFGRFLAAPSETFPWLTEFAGVLGLKNNYDFELATKHESPCPSSAPRDYLSEMGVYSAQCTCHSDLLISRGNGRSLSPAVHENPPNNVECDAAFAIVHERTDDRIDPALLLSTVCGIATTTEGWKRQSGKLVTVWRNGEVPHAVCRLKENLADGTLRTLSMWETVHVLHRSFLASGGFAVHGGLVEYKGRGALLAAAAGGGKSTCCSMMPAPWETLCDDETLILPKGFAGFVAHPFPTWSNRIRGVGRQAWDVHRNVPLKALFFLEKADRDAVVPVGQGEAAMMLVGSARSYVDPRSSGTDGSAESLQAGTALFHAACEVAVNVPAYRLHASLEGGFRELMVEVLER